MTGTDDFSLRSIALPAFGPTAVWSVGVGAALPVVALSARDLGASVAVAAAFVLIEGMSAFVSSLPAGSLVARIGERRALAGAALVDAVGAALAVVAPNLVTLGIAIGLMGMTGSVFMLARQSWLTARAPVRIRARAMSTMGGVQRIGLFVGPFVAAPIIAIWGTQAAYAVAVVAGLLAAVWAWVGLRDADTAAIDPANSGAGHRWSGGSGRGGPERVGLRDVIRRHRAVVLTIGVGVIIIGAARQGRFVIVPLWAESVGITDSQTALIFGIAGGAEVLLFYPAGSIMDRFGRVWVAVPFLVILGAGMVLLPLTHGFTAVAAVSTLMGIGNGLGSGIVQTLGADAAPVAGRAQFLSVWRFLSLIGQNGAPLLVSGVTLLAGLGPACVVLGVLVLGGAPWLARWLPAYDPRRAAAKPVRA
ncbi:transporter [Knoellia sinensis KCTC 19936]|uniref:Transporter n=1 Tax=Knoellia sinensis KCTC 19936 TaxID=1385520 RepID=A0A0A0IZL9_9MICO|nr:MFS transporter [Knoellia sinensis]KGN30615.1 transporter [Knoellia sinensis KCTC 19936]